MNTRYTLSIAALALCSAGISAHAATYGTPTLTPPTIAPPAVVPPDVVAGVYWWPALNVTYVPQNGGNVAIGTDTPSALLTVRGTADFLSYTKKNTLRIGRNSKEHFRFYVTDRHGYFDYFQDSDSNRSHTLAIRNLASGSGENGIAFYIGSNVAGGFKGNRGFYLKAGLSVSGQAQLADGLSVSGNAVFNNDVHVNKLVSWTGLAVAGKSTFTGTLHAARVVTEEIRVDSDWADFVFHDDYDLKSLDEVERYIEENGHLPDVPSAADVKANGVSIGASQANLLQKIEELTLYVIQQSKEIEKLSSALGRK